MLEYKPEYEIAKRRMDAFWANELIDRPLVSITYLKEDAEWLTRPEYKSHEDYWLDIEFRAEEDAQYMKNLVFYADAMPVVFPNLGPGIFSAWSGCPYTFGQDTAWTNPCIVDWEQDYFRAVWICPIRCLKDRGIYQIIDRIWEGQIYCRPYGFSSRWRPFGCSSRF